MLRKICRPLWINSKLRYSYFLVCLECIMAFTRCDKCGELRFDKKINLCANCGHRITRVAKSFE